LIPRMKAFLYWVAGLNRPGVMRRAATPDPGHKIDNVGAGEHRRARRFG
jgi:hypothetical protein